MKLCIDAGPTENVHRHRGIGWATSHILQALTSALTGGHGLEVCYLRRHPLGPILADHLRHAPRSGSADWAGLDPRVPSWLRDRWKAIETTIVLPRDVQAAGAEVFLATDPQAIALSRHFRTVVVLYDLIPLLFPDMYLPWSAPLARLLYHRDLRRLRQADRLVAISEATKRDAVRLLGLHPNRISVVHLAVDEALFHPIDPDQARAHVERHYGIDRPFFFYAGGFDPRKNVEGLIAAFRAADLGEHLLAIAGSVDGGGARLQAAFAGDAIADRIRWLGYLPVEELRFLYAASVALAFPSLYEGFGLPVLEAMRCGAPVLTSQRSSLPEVAGDAALYADPTSPSELADALKRLARDPGLRSELRARGIERTKRFSWARTAQRILEICRQVGA